MMILSYNTSHPMGPPPSAEILPTRAPKPPSPDRVRIATWNIQTLNRKTDYLRSFLEEYFIHSLGLTETNGDEKTDIDSLFPDHHWIGRPSIRHGGVGFLIHYSILVNKKLKIFS